MRSVVFFPLPPLSPLTGVAALPLGLAILSFICGVSFVGGGGIVKLNPPPLLVAILEEATGGVSPPPFDVLFEFVRVAGGFLAAVVPEQALRCSVMLRRGMASPHFSQCS